VVFLAVALTPAAARAQAGPDSRAANSGSEASLQADNSREAQTRPVAQTGFEAQAGPEAQTRPVGPTGPEAQAGEIRQHTVAVLGLLEVPTDEPISEVYGSHPGVAGRYVYRASESWSIAGDLAYRGPEGETENFGLEAKLRVLELGAMLRYHPPLGVSSGALDLWLGGGVTVQRLEERVSFPGGPLETDDGAAGWLLGAGIERLLGRGLGVLADVRFSRLSISSGLEGIEDTELGGFGLLGGVFVSF
jgi:hypothetical protein